MAEVALTRGYQQVAAAADKILDQIAVAENAIASRGFCTRTRTRGLFAEDGVAGCAVGLRFRGRLGRPVHIRETADRSRGEFNPGSRDCLRLGVFGLTSRRATSRPKNHSAAKRMGNHHARRPPPRTARELSGGVLLELPVSAPHWCDGKRNLAEVIRLTELEMGPQQFDFVGYFKFLQKHGYVEFVTAN